jgi:hypothetical protein
MDDNAKLAEQVGGEVAQSFNHAGHAIVRINPPKGVINNRNVYAVADCGEIVWQVEENGAVYEDSPYTNMAVKTDGLHLYNWDGMDVLIDAATGKILKQAQGK